MSYFLRSGASWEIHHEAASRVYWLAEDASTEREVLVCDNRWDFLVESFDVKFLYVKTGVERNLLFKNDVTIFRQSCWLCLPCSFVCPRRGLVSILVHNNVFFKSVLFLHSLWPDVTRCLLLFDGQERSVWYCHLLRSQTLLLHRSSALLETWGGKGGKMCGQIGDRCSDWVSNVLLT